MPTYPGYLEATTALTQRDLAAAHVGRRFWCHPHNAGSTSYKMQDLWSCGDSMEGQAVSS